MPDATNATNTADTGRDDLSEGTVTVPVAWLEQLGDYLADASALYRRQYGETGDFGRAFLRDITRSLVLARQQQTRFEEAMRYLDESVNVNLRLLVTVPAPTNSGNAVADGFAFLQTHWARLWPFIAIEQGEWYNQERDTWEGGVDDIPADDQFWNTRQS